MQQLSPVEYVYVGIANAFGLDGESWDTRIDWVESKSVDDMYNLIDSANEPMMYVSSINALEQAMNGEPTGYMMSLDCTSSGIQIMACLSGCHTTAANCNLIDTGKREDVYRKITEEMAIPNVTRKLVKTAGMTHFYNSQAEPKMIFGEDTPELAKFYATLEKELPGAEDVMAMINSCVDPSATEYQWTLPDGFTVVYRVMDEISSKIEVDELDHATFTYVAQVNQAKDYDSSLCAHVMHSIDGWLVRETVKRCMLLGFEAMTIHDCFWCSPNHMQKLREVVRDLFCELADMDLLQSILRQITGDSSLVVGKDSDNLSELIKDAEYFIS